MTPEYRASVPLPDMQDPEALFNAWRGLIVPAEEQGFGFVRMTYVGPMHEVEGVEHGLYLEAWTLQPAEQPAFEWPAEAA